MAPNKEHVDTLAVGMPTIFLFNESSKLKNRELEMLDMIKKSLKENNFFVTKMGNICQILHIF